MEATVLSTNVSAPVSRLLSLRRVGLALIGGALSVACAFLAQHPADPMRVPAWVVIVTLLAIAGAALVFPDPFPAYSRTLDAVAVPLRTMLPAAALYTIPALLAVSIWLQEPFSAHDQFIHSSSTWAVVLWVAGMIVGLIAALPSADARVDLSSARLPRLVLEGAALLVILDVAAALRLYHLSVLPEGVWFDEADFANSAHLLQSMPFQPFGAFEVGHEPSLYFYVMALLIKIGGMTIGAVRSTSVLFGIFAVLCAFGLGRKLGGPALGLSAAALLAINQWAIDFSRFGMSNIAAPAMISAGLWALAFGMRRPRPFWFLLSGTLLGLSLLTYEGAFIAGSGVALGVIFLRFLLDQRFRSAAWPAVIFLPLGLLVGTAPLLTVLGLDSNYTLAREQTVSLFNEYHGLAAQLSALGHNLRLHLLMFTVAGDHNGRHNLSGAPMLDPVTGALFLLGLGICIRRIRHWFAQTLLIWLAASMAWGIFSLDYEAPQAARTIVAVAPIALIAALPLVLLARAVYEGMILLAARGRVPRRQQPGWKCQVAGVALSTVIILIPLGAAGASNVHQYFVAQANSYTSWSEMDGLQALLGREARVLVDAGYTVEIAPELVGDNVVTFTSGGLHIPAFDASVPVPLPVPAGGLALLIPTSDQNVLSFVQQSFPRATMLPLTPAYDHTNIQAYAVLVHPADAAASLGVDAYFQPGNAILQHVVGPIPWPLGAPPAATVKVQATMLLMSDESWRPVAFRVVGARQATLTIDGARWTNAQHGTPPIRLGAGNHALVISARGRTAPTLSLQWTLGVSAIGVPAAQWTDVPNTLLASPAMPTGGLLGLYYEGPRIAGVPVLARVDQSVYTYFQNPPIPGWFPFATLWRGTLLAPVSGSYRFRLDSTGPSTLSIDGHEVTADSGVPGSGTIMLSAGRHTIRVTYSATGSYLHCYLTWAPPGQFDGPIPASDLLPDHG